MNTERENMDQLIKQITVQAQTGVHLLFQGAKKEEIEALEKSLGVILPLSFQEFLKFSNGAILNQTDEIFGTKDAEEGIPPSVLTMRQAIEDLPAQLIPFYYGSDFNCFDIARQSDGEYPIVRWNKTTGKFQDLNPSFPKWLHQKIEEYSLP